MSQRMRALQDSGMDGCSSSLDQSSIALSNLVSLRHATHTWQRMSECASLFPTCMAGWNGEHYCLLSLAVRSDL